MTVTHDTTLNLLIDWISHVRGIYSLSEIIAQPQAMDGLSKTI